MTTSDSSADADVAGRREGGRTLGFRIATCDLPREVTHVWAPDERVLLVRSDLTEVELFAAVHDAIEHVTWRGADVDRRRVVPLQADALSA